MILTGEASGDLHGANLVKAIRKIDSHISFFGTGGKALKKEGSELFLDIKSLSVMGLTEVLAKMHLILKALRESKQILKERRPNLLILIDFPEFNLTVAKTAKRLGIPVLYYISPKVWAWRSGRIKTIKARVDRMVIILPFEEEFYRNENIPYTYVGHPLMDTKLSEYPYPSIDEKEDKIIGILPGSREKEVLRILPEIMETAKLLSKEQKDLKFLVSVAPSLDISLIHHIVDPYRSEINLGITTDSVYDIFKILDFAIAASGTVTLEAAIAGIPMVVLYKMSSMSYFFARRLVKLKYASLVNLIAGREVVPELLQNDANPKNIAVTINRLLKDETALDQMKNELIKVRTSLGEPGASTRVAKIALEMMT